MKSFMHRRFLIFGGAVFLFVLFCGFRIIKINQHVPHHIEMVKRELPYTMDRDHFKVVLNDYTIEEQGDGSLTDDGQKEYTCTFNITVETDAEFSPETDARFPFSLRRGQLGGSNFPVLSSNISSGRNKGWNLEPDQSIEGTMQFSLSLDPKDDLKDLVLLIKPSAFIEKYDQKWEEGAVYFEFIPLEADHVAS